VKIKLDGIVIIAGNYGSGKTEISINLAINKKRSGINVRIADLDLVNPYFRTREARNLLSKNGIDLVVPPEQYLQADLPILSPSVAGMIKHPVQLTLIDAGGDDVGVRVLASLADALRGKEIRMLQVVNPFRPFTETIEGCLEMRSKIEKVSKISVSGIIGNPNLIDETTVDHIYKGNDFLKKLSAQSGLPIEFIAIASNLFQKINVGRFECPLLPIARQLVPPWLEAVEFE
jgi:MinD-like ATPase involved in chromosome partitioning or flagellar assembly